MGLRLRRAIWANLYRLSVPAAHPKSVVSLVSRSDQGGARAARAMTDASVRNAERVVLADVGGTNVRFAVLTGNAPGPIEHMAVSDHERFIDALAAFMARQTERAAIRCAIFA